VHADSAPPSTLHKKLAPASPWKAIVVLVCVSTAGGPESSVGAGGAIVSTTNAADAGVGSTTPARLIARARTV